MIKCFRKCGVPDNMTPVQETEYSVDKQVPTPNETTSSDVLGDVTWDEFMSFDNELPVTNNNHDDWENRIIAKANVATNGFQLSDPESDEEENESAVAVSFIVS